MDYAHFLAICRDIYLGAGGVDLVIFGRHKHDNEDDYDNFEVVMSGDCDNPYFDYNFHFNEDLYVLDGWLRLYDMMELLHEKMLEGE